MTSNQMTINDFNALVRRAEPIQLRENEYGRYTHLAVDHPDADVQQRAREKRVELIDKYQAHALEHELLDAAKEGRKAENLGFSDGDNNAALEWWRNEVRTELTAWIAADDARRKAELDQARLELLGTRLQPDTNEVVTRALDLRERISEADTIRREARLRLADRIRVLTRDPNAIERACGWSPDEYSSALDIEKAFKAVEALQLELQKEIEESVRQRIELATETAEYVALRERLQPRTTAALEVLEPSEPSESEEPSADFGDESEV